MPKKAKPKKTRALARKTSRAALKARPKGKVVKASRPTKRLKSLSPPRRANPPRRAKLGKPQKSVEPVRKEFEMVPSGFLVKTEEGWVPLMMRREKALPR